MPGVCYSALRRLPRRDLHPLESNSQTVALARSRRHDATSERFYASGESSLEPEKPLPAAGGSDGRGGSDHAKHRRGRQRHVHAVNAAFASEDSATIDALKTTLDGFNNAGSFVCDHPG
jgi:hypothetical protein